MDIVLNWIGHFSFTSEEDRSLLQNPEGTPRVGRLESPVTGSIAWDPLIGVLGRRYLQMKAIGLNWR